MSECYVTYVVMLYLDRRSSGIRNYSYLLTDTNTTSSMCKHCNQHRISDEEVMWDMHNITTEEQAETNRMTQLIEQLKRHEGLKLEPYKCTAGKLTIGIGRNLEDVGISEQEAEMLLLNDIERAGRLLKDKFPWTMELDEVRFAALINFTFNVGIGTVSKFVNAMALLKAGNYDTAADEFLQSRWASQVGHRALEVSEQIRTGEWQ